MPHVKPNPEPSEEGTASNDVLVEVLSDLRVSTPVPTGNESETSVLPNKIAAGSSSKEKSDKTAASEPSKRPRAKSELRKPRSSTPKRPMKEIKPQSHPVTQKEKPKTASTHLLLPSPPSKAKSKKSNFSPTFENRLRSVAMVPPNAPKSKGKAVRQLKFAPSSSEPSSCSDANPITESVSSKPEVPKVELSAPDVITGREVSGTEKDAEDMDVEKDPKIFTESEARSEVIQVMHEPDSSSDIVLDPPRSENSGKESSPGVPSSDAMSPMTKTLSLRRFRRSLSDAYPCNLQTIVKAGRRASEITPATNSVDSLRVLNHDLRDQVTRLRTQLEAQLGHIKQAQWQKVVHIRQVRQQEQHRCAVTLTEQRVRLEKEKARELELLREQLVQKAENDLQKLSRFKDAEVNKLKLELESKDAMLQRLLGENRHARVRLNIDDRKSKLLDELKELRQAKRDLEESLTNASFAERNFSNDLRKHSASFESEVAKVKREAQVENRQLIEQLKNKDKIISQLEKDLGHHWGAAQFAALERRRSEGAPHPPGGPPPSQPLRALPDGSESPDTLPWTPTSATETEGVEDVWSKLLEGNALSKPDLHFKLKDSKDRTKELLEKCRSYLQQNKELTARNRAFQESNERANQEFKKAQELLEHSKLQVLHLNRQLSHVTMERGNLEQQARGLDRLREEIAEDKKIINALRKACSDKDRRIELIQHRKKRRRVLGSAEKQKFQTAGLRETYYGYEEDSKMADADQSLSSSIASTLSDDDVWDDELSREEIERNYQRLVLEHMELQKSHALLQRQTGNMLDPQREHLDKTALQNDLFSAQCRIEHLEKLVNEIGEGEVKQLLMEREAMIEANRQLEGRARNLDNGYRQLQKELTKAEERSEELEFRLMEMEQCEDRDQNSSWDVSSTSHTPEDSLATTSTEQPPPPAAAAAAAAAATDHQHCLWQEVHQEMEQLRQDLTALLKGKGKDAEAVLKKLDQLKDTERKMEGLEVMAQELQVKVISLQQENTSLQDKLLMVEESRMGKGDHSASLAAAKERKENLELKATGESQDDMDPKSSRERKHLLDEVKSWKTQCQVLQRQLDVATRKHRKHSEPEIPCVEQMQSSVAHSSANSPSPHTLLPPVLVYNKKSSHRKSKARGSDDPTMSKRRRNSRDHELSTRKDRKLRRMKSEGDAIGDAEYKPPATKGSKLADDSLTMPDACVGEEDMKKRISFLEREIVSLKKDRKELMRQIKQAMTEKTVGKEGDQMLKDRVIYLERELDLLHKENVALGEQLRQRADEFQYQRDDLNPRVSELEEYCEDLQERLHGSETVERQLREKLKFVEGNIDDAENNELAMREQCRQLLSSDLEAKKQIQALQSTGQELKDIVLEKEFVEQALRDKVDFLQKAEAASVKRIEELEQIELELREQLEQKSDGKGQRQKDAHKIQELKHQMTFLQKDNQALSARVTELEENEETLRENWRRVADEDFNRTQCLEEKVKMLDSLNRELKSKLSDAQEYFVINTVPQLDTSLAAELAESQSSRPALSEDELDRETDAISAENVKDFEMDKRAWKEKMRKLERQLSEVSEQKNTKIESLQEQLVGLRETEIKLSETISEMEMTERELRAKLALYESSEVTVEKMLKYQSKIEELRTSQESLLDQLESMENQEMSLQEKMQEMERTLRGKIVTLEVEMKRFKQKELKNAGRIRDLEKLESSLTTKVAQQAEKENGLYMKINTLMEDLKATKASLETARSQLEEKEEKVRQAKLLEVKLLEIEMDYGKKTNELNTKLRHQEEEFRQKDSAHEEEIRSLRGEVSRMSTQEKEQRKQWENELTQRNNEAQTAVSVLHTDLNKVNEERESLEKEVDSLRDEVNKLTDVITEKEGSILSLSEEMKNEKQKSQEAEEKASLLESQLAHEKQRVSETEEKLQDLKSEIESKTVDMNSFVAEKESEYQRQLSSMESEIEMKKRQVNELEEQLQHETDLVRQLQTEKNELNDETLQAKTIFSEGSLNLKNISEELLSKLDEELRKKLNVMDERLQTAQDNMRVLSVRISDSQNKDVVFQNEKASIIREWEDKLMSVREEQSSKEDELKSKVMSLDNRLQQEVMEKEVQQTSFQQASHEKETALKSEVESLQQDVETHKRELITKLSELEAKNKEHCELSLKFSELRHSHKTLQKDHDYAKESFLDAENKLKSSLSEKSEKLSESERTIQTLSEEIKSLKSSLEEKDDVVQKLSQDKELIVKEKYEESQRVSAEKSHKAELESHLATRIKEVEEIKCKHSELENEIKTLREGTQENHVLMDQYIQEKESISAELKKSKDEHFEISQELSHASENLKEKETIIEEQNQKLSTLTSELKELTVKFEQKEQELSQLSSDLKVSESQHLSQLSENQQTLEKYTETTRQLQNSIELKDQTILARDQKCKEIQSELEDLSLQLKDRDQKLQQAETQVADATLKLKQIENRYRELESKCASMELTLEERFAVAEDAKQVLAKKEIQCKEIEEQLAKAEKNVATLQGQVSSGSEDSRSLIQSLQSKENELKKLQTEIHIMNEELERKSQDSVSLEAKLEEVRQESSYLEKQCEQEKEKASTTENCLLETEKECQALHEKLLENQNHLSKAKEDQTNLEDQITLLQSMCDENESKIQILTGSLDEYEVACQEKNARVSSLEQELSEWEKSNSEERERVADLQDQFDKSCADVKVLQKQLEDAEAKVQAEKKEKAEIKSQLEVITDQFEIRRLDTEQLDAELVINRNKFEEKEKHLKDCQKEMASLEQKHTESISLCEELKSQLQAAQNLCEERTSQVQQMEGTLLATQTELDDQKTKLERIMSEGKDSRGQMQELQELYSDSKVKIDQLEEVLMEKESQISILKDQISEHEQTVSQVTLERNTQLDISEKRSFEIHDKEDKIKSLSSELDALSLSVASMEEENKSLDKTVRELQGNLSEATRQCSDLSSTNQSLSIRLSDFEKQHGDLHPKLLDFEMSLSKACQERDDVKRELNELKSEKDVLEDENQQLQEELESASKEFEDLQVSCEQSKANIEKRMRDMNQEKQELEGNFEKQTIALGDMEQRIKVMESKEKEAEKVVSELKEVKNSVITFTANNEQLEQERSSLINGIRSLKEEVKILEANAEKQSAIHTSFNQVQKDNEDLQRQISETMKENLLLHSEIQHLKDQISSSAQKSDCHSASSISGGEILSEQLIQVSAAPSLQSSLKSSRNPTSSSQKPQGAGQDDQMGSLTAEISDFKLKDDSYEQEMINLEKSLKESQVKEKTMQKRVDELECVEKELREQIVDIEMTVIVPMETENQELKDEIAMVRQERDEAISKVSLWDDEENGVDAMESARQALEDALVQLEELEKKNEVLLADIAKLESETESLVRAKTELETDLMERDEKMECLQEEIDRLVEMEKKVMVLEESETKLMDRMLDLEEREQGLIRELQRVTSEKEDLENAEHQSKQEDLEKKLKYLEEKNQVLQDAEGHYMEKVMELEEDVERLRAELSSKSSATVEDVTRIDIKMLNNNVVTVDNSLSVSTQTSVPFQDDAISGANKNISAVDSLEENDVGHLRSQLVEVEKSKTDLLSQFYEKDSKISYLEDKLELLRDSEAGLMEKLLESEENLAQLKSDISKARSELNAKIEHLQEENDFLAGNVENYQKLYKDEKERSNDLQDRVMEDSSRLAELQRTQQELADAQKMVQEIQCEYEEQLSERLCDEAKLKEEFSSQSAKCHQLEQDLAAKCQTEVELMLRIDTLERSEKDLKTRVEALVRGEEDESLLSDSGLSGDDPRLRHDPNQNPEGQILVETPIAKTSNASILLSTPRPHPQAKTDQTKQQRSLSPHTPNLPPITSDEEDSRTLSARNLDRQTQKDLIFLVESLQQREEVLKNRVRELTALVNDTPSSTRLRELEARNLDLETRLRHVEVDTASVSLSEGDRLSVGLLRAEGKKRQKEGVKEEGSVLGRSSPSSAMLEKPEDVLMQRIRELEGLDKHNKNQLSELEKDREVLHEIARKDKGAIHDLNVKIRELQLSERSLKEQVANLEVSENSLFAKCEELEATRIQLEDRVHELEIHERRLRELVRKLKLDEERWLSKSGGFETAVAELSANEQQLKRILQDVEMEKGGLSERAEYLEARIRELESVETSLLSRVQNYETNEVSLQNRLVLLENSETASRSKSSELDILNKDLTQRMKKVSDENAMMSQHLSQLHGQVQELDRRLLASRDSELAFKQHVESLQKNESLLQKKVREYELREIDSQSQVRELEQMLEINKDKLAALQRSENRLKYRVQELEGLGAPIPGELTPSQRQKIPQKLEDCQKRIVVLQSQVENLQLQLRQALNTTSTSQAQPAQKSDDNNNVTIATEEYSQLHAKAAMLDETRYQNEELETVNEHLNNTILELRQGKGACGHEVEIEVLKRRIGSQKTFIDKLKSSLSEGQATSLSDPDQDSGAQGETLPARNLQVLESERVLQSVRGLHHQHDGKADTALEGVGHLGGPVPVEETMTQMKTTKKMAAPSTQQGSQFDPYSTGVQTTEAASSSANKNLEEPHWKAIEARKPAVANDSRGGVPVTAEREAGSAAQSASPRKQRQQQSPSSEVEEVTMGLHLQSESEYSSHYRATSQTDTDSTCSPVAPPRRARAKRASKNFDPNASSGTESGGGAEPLQTSTSKSASAVAAMAAAANQKHFDSEKSLPWTAHHASNSTSTPRRGYESSPTTAPLSRFGEDSFYLPSSAQEGVDSLDDDEAPPLPASGPPGAQRQEPTTTTMMMMSPSSRRSSEASVSMPLDRGDSGDSMDNSTSGMSIRDRIAMIEKNLRSDTQASSIGSRDDEDGTLFWKKKSSDFSRQVECLDKENKFMKEDLPPAFRRKEKINRLEKELEEKRRYINTLEIWLSSTEELLRNKSKQTDREMVEQLQMELAKLRKELKQAGYRSEDALLDPAALKTELEHRDKEILSKRNEIDSLTHEVRRWHKECHNIEGMRRTALDSLRQLEREILGLQESEKQLGEAHAELHKLKSQYESKQLDLQNVIMEKEDVEFALKSVILERDGLKVELRQVEQERSELKPQLEHFHQRVEDLAREAAKSSALQDQLNGLNHTLLQRTDKTREVYEENLNLRDRVNESEGELSRYRTLCDDFNNLSARYDEMEQFKNQALAMVQPLQLKVERLTSKCKEKDALLRRLGSELRRGLHRPSSALEELTRLERAMASEEYNLANSEETRNGTLSPRSDYNHIRARSISMDELNFSHSDSDSVHSASSPNISPIRRQRPTPYVNNRPRSAETVGTSLHGSPRRLSARSRWNSRSQSRNTAAPQVYQGQFVAIADYDPGLFSQSGRPKLELLLREGDQVTVTGPMDRHGYCEAQVSGRTGLVPAIYLQPASQPQPAAPVVNGHASQTSVIHLKHSPPSTGDLIQSMQPEHDFAGTNGVDPSSPRPQEAPRNTPDPPHHLHIKGVTGDSLVLAWLPPTLDLRGCNKGFTLTGYKIYVNNQEYDQVPDPQCCEVVIKDLNLMYPVQLAVQSLCADDHVSPRTELVFEGMVSIVDNDVHQTSQKGLDTDLSSVLNSVQYKRGHRKTVIALYDYNPEQQSPHDYTAYELPFLAGDVISVYGQPRPDGFFHGEIDGKRGLIPACFVEDMPSTRRPFRDGLGDAVNSSSKA